MVNPDCGCWCILENLPDIPLRIQEDPLTYLVNARLLSDRLNYTKYIHLIPKTHASKRCCDCQTLCGFIGIDVYSFMNGLLNRKTIYVDMRGSLEYRKNKDICLSCLDIYVRLKQLGREKEVW